MNGKLKAILLLGVMYGLGAVSGIAFQTYRFRHGGFSHEVFAERRIKRLTTQLKLLPPQQQALRDIFRKAHDRATEINEEVSWDLADIHKDSVQAIRQVLTPDQLREFEKLHKDYHEHHKHMLDEDEQESTGTPRAVTP